MRNGDIFLFLKIFGNALCNPLFIKEKKRLCSLNDYPGSKGIETLKKIKSSNKRIRLNDYPGSKGIETSILTVFSAFSQV